MRHYVRPDGMPPVNGYSHAVSFSGTLVVISGQVSLDADGNVVGAGDALAQARQVFANLSTALAAAGSGLDRIVKLTVFLTDMADLATFRQVRAQVLPDPPPASTLVQVVALANPQLRIEVEALALAAPAD